MTISQMVYENAVDLFNSGLMDEKIMQQFKQSHEIAQREIPQLTDEDIATFTQIEQKAKSITLDDLLK